MKIIRKSPENQQKIDRKSMNINRKSMKFHQNHLNSIENQFKIKGNRKIENPMQIKDPPKIM